ncbi:MAG: beta-propeller fold lactonase family protein [Candidatus Hydrogenedentes bacterium]|nr:beta-propeller fold lactonase family protein [Candidatus Hydrogenedentota bacterium]
MRLANQYRFTWLSITLVSVAALMLLGAGHGERPGERPGERILLPNQWYLDPVGEQRPLGDFPMNMALSPDGQYLTVVHCGVGEHEVIMFNATTTQRISRTVLKNAYYGLTFSPDGSRLYVSGGEDEVIHVFKFSRGYLSDPETIRIAPEKEQRVPCGLALNADGKLLAVAEAWGNGVDFVDPEKGELKVRVAFPQESRPYDCKFSSDGKFLYVSLWGKATLVALDVADPTGAHRELRVGDHPNELALSPDGKRLFVACANSNTVAVIDTDHWTVHETLNTALYPESLEGSTPNSVVLTPDGTRLLVANADNNSLAVFDVSEPRASRSLGLIPTGWYPTSVRVSQDGQSIFVANSKGCSPVANSQGPNPYDRGERRRTTEQYIGIMLPGTLSVIKIPEARSLEDLTRRVYACSPYRQDRTPITSPREGNPIPAKVGDSSPIKHCIYIIKENRTYDQVLGDMPEGNGDPGLCLFPEKFTPNHHALARAFVLLDNFYVESQVSADGHEWSTGAYATDFVQKTWPSGYGDHGLDYPSEGNYTTAFPSAGYIWDRCREANVSYRSYGEFVNVPEKVGDLCTTNIETLQGHFHPYFRGWDLDYPDVDRANMFIEEFERLVKEGALPQFIIMRLPNDHTAGTKEGSFTPRAMVADNDLALGRVVEAVSKSPVWKETAIFVVEDDAQNGPDHIDAHRTVAFVISPYTYGRGRDSTFYSTASMLRTMELILGLQPMSQFDAGARPMYDTFLSTPHLAPYPCRPVADEIRLRRNSPEAWGAEQSAKLNLDKEDAADDLLFNEIIWRAIRGADHPMPAPVRAAFSCPVGASGRF